jgi:hypothetical protein
MADGQKTTWGGAIGGIVKGTVKIAAVVAVSIGIAAGAAWGLDAAFSGAESDMLAKAGGAGAAVGAGITNVTTSIVDFFGDTFSNIGEWLNGKPDGAQFGEKIAEIAETKAPEGLEGQELTDFMASAVEHQAEFAQSYLADVSTDITKATEAVTEISDKHAEYVALHPNLLDGADIRDIASPFSEMLYQGEAYKQSLIDLKATLSGLEGLEDDKLVQAFETLDVREKLNAVFTSAEPINMSAYDLAGDRIDLLKEIQGLDPSNASDVTQIEKLQSQVGLIEDVQESNTIENGYEVAEKLHGKAEDVFDPRHLNNVPEKWMAAGAATVGLGAYGHLKKAEGQREVVGHFTQAEAQRQASAAQMAGLRNQLG